MNKIIFLYDKLMTKEEQDLLNIDLQFLSYGVVNGRLRWFNDTKHKRIMLLPYEVTMRLVYGGIYLCDDYKHEKYKLHSYYNNSQPFTGETIVSDIFDVQEIEITPIKIKSIKDLKDNTFEMGEKTKCMAFLPNYNSSYVQYRLEKDYYRRKATNTNSFIKLIQENNYGRTGN